jgi:hypothetical protein
MNDEKNGLTSEEQAELHRMADARTMRSSTFKAIASLEESKPEDWDPEYLQEVIENVEAVDRVRWMERGTWIGAVIGLAVGAFLLGWNMKPIPAPEPVKWDCSVEFSSGERDQVDCTGVGEA